MTTPNPNLPAARPKSSSEPAASIECSQSLSKLSEDLSKAPEHQTGLPVTARLKIEADRALEALDRALAPAPRPVEAKWLAALGAVMPHSPTAAPFDERLRAILALVEFPSRCYTDDTLKLAARTFKFFPTIAELTSLFDPMLADLRDQRRALARVAAAPLSPVRPGRVRTEIELQRQAEGIAKARQVIADGQADMARFRKIEADGPKRAPVHIPNPILDGYVERARKTDAAQREANEYRSAVANAYHEAPDLKPIAAALPRADAPLQPGGLSVDWLDEAANG